jgi:hypothetical protein
LPVQDAAATDRAAPAEDLPAQTSSSDGAQP